MSQPVTLRQHDSINLTTGVVTRSDVALRDRNFAREFAVAIRKGVERNDLEALHEMIMETAPSGDCAWTPTACRQSQADHRRHPGCIAHPVKIECELRSN